MVNEVRAAYLLQAALNIVAIVARPFCSYTNDVARLAENCQALLEAKNAAAD
jgi:hypothetical protein